MTATETIKLMRLLSKFLGEKINIDKLNDIKRIYELYKNSEINLPENSHDKVIYVSWGDK